MPTLNVVRREFDVTPTLHDDALYRNNPRASIYRIDPSVAAWMAAPGDLAEVTSRVLGL